MSIDTFVPFAMKGRSYHVIWDIIGTRPTSGRKTVLSFLHVVSVGSFFSVATRGRKRGFAVLFWATFIFESRVFFGNV